MTPEQISLNGAPVIGFGAGDATAREPYGVMIGVPFLGIIAGAVGGAALGKGAIGTTAGAVAGGVVGFIGGIALTNVVLRATQDKK